MEAFGAPSSASSIWSDLCIDAVHTILSLGNSDHLQVVLGRLSHPGLQRSATLR